MAESQSGPSNARKRKYRSVSVPINHARPCDKGAFWQDGVSPTWAKRTIEGAGIWATCVKGKEKGTVGELYDVFESVNQSPWAQIRHVN